MDPKLKITQEDIEYNLKCAIFGLKINDDIKYEVVHISSINDLCNAIQHMDRNCLVSVEIRNHSKLEKIDSTIFRDLPELRSITIPESITYIDPNAFLGCPKLEEVIFAEKVEKIDVWFNQAIKLTLHKPFDDIAKYLREGYALDLDPDSRDSYWD